MSMYWCARCDQLKDSDDGCEEYKRIHLICMDCVADLEDDAETYETNQGGAAEGERVHRMRAEMKEKMK